MHKFILHMVYYDILRFIKGKNYDLRYFYICIQ